MNLPKVVTFRISGLAASLLMSLAYRSTKVAKETKGHRHTLFSFYLTQGLHLRDADGQLHEPKDEGDDELTLWIVLPRAFHEWVNTADQSGTVHDITPLHQPHNVVQ